MPSCFMVYRTTCPSLQKKRRRSHFYHRLAENRPSSASYLIWGKTTCVVQFKQPKLYLSDFSEANKEAFQLYSQQSWQHHLANNQVISPTNIGGSAQDKTQEISFSSTKYILLLIMKTFKRKEYNINTGKFQIYFRPSKFFMKFQSPPKENWASLSSEKNSAHLD